MLWQRLINYRIANQLTQSEVAKLCGVTNVTISNIENRKFKPTKRTVKKIELVIGGDEDETRESYS